MSLFVNYFYMNTESPKTASHLHEAMHRPQSKLASLLFAAVFVGGLIYLFLQLNQDISGVDNLSTTAIIMLIAALLIALGFEFVNGFHDTANAVATVIYTHSLPPSVAVVWSGVFNFLGVLFSSGMVAFGIIALLPVELILNVSSENGFAMVFALLCAAILWNLGTWFFGLPASSSHTLIGSILGVGIANAVIHGRPAITGVDWAQVQKIGLALLISPLIGFGLAALLLLLAKRVFRHHQELFDEPQGNKPPPKLVRGLLILTCTGVSFAHGSNDGQKGMGLIMLILVGVLPVVYGLNQSVTPQEVARFAALSQSTVQVVQQHHQSATPLQGNSEQILIDYVRTRELNPQVLPALAAEVGMVGNKLAAAGDYRRLNSDAVSDLRNQMYLTSESIKQLLKSPEIKSQTALVTALRDYQKAIDNSTKFIPVWVKVVVALALGLGTMVGWRRIVITVGEKIGKSHLTYAQGASAEMVAMTTIGIADVFGLPVSTTHVLSSGVAGTMAANKSGIQKQTLINLLLAWVSTLPAAMLLSGVLYWLFSQLF